MKAVAALVIAFALAACSSTTPSPGPTRVGPTLPPTPATTFRTLSAADLGEGWTIIATDSNVSGVPRIEILGNAKVGTSFAMVCVGAGTARVSFAAAGGRVSLPPVGANQFYSTTYTCPTMVHEYLTNDYDQGGISISPSVDASDGVTYQLIVGTQPG